MKFPPELLLTLPLIAPPFKLTVPRVMMPPETEPAVWVRIPPPLIVTPPEIVPLLLSVAAVISVRMPEIEPLLSSVPPVR